MRKLKFEDPDELERKITEYFTATKNAEKPPTMSGLALFLGTARRTLLNYIDSANTEGTSKKARCGELLVMAKAQIECYLEERLITDYSRGLEFVLKNGYQGWGEKVTVAGEVEVKHEGEVEIGVVKMTDEELMNRLNVLKAKAEEIMKKEGLADGADGG